GEVLERLFEAALHRTRDITLHIASYTCNMQGCKCRLIRSPGPAPPRPGAARRSSPWHGTVRWLLIAQHGLAPTGRFWHTGCKGQGGSGPGAGAWRVRRPG